MVYTVMLNDLHIYMTCKLMYIYLAWDNQHYKIIIIVFIVKAPSCLLLVSLWKSHTAGS